MKALPAALVLFAAIPLLAQPDHAMIEERLSGKKREAIRLAGELGRLVETRSYGDEAQWKE